MLRWRTQRAELAAMERRDDTPVELLESALPLARSDLPRVASMPQVEATRVWCAMSARM